MQQDSATHPNSPPIEPSAEPLAELDAAISSSNLSSPTKASKPHKVVPANASGTSAVADVEYGEPDGGKVQSVLPSKPLATGSKKKSPKEESKGGSAAAAEGGAPLRCVPSAAPQPQPQPSSQSLSLALVPVARQRCQIFVDVSNIWTGLKGDMRALRSLLERVQTEDSLLKLDGRYAFGSKTPEFASSECDWEAAFKDEGFIVRSELRPHGGKESMVDDCIAAHMYRAIIDKRVECIVLLSGDGNQRNPSLVSIIDAVLSALESRIRVVVWCWKKCGNEHYRALQRKFPDSLFSLKFLDDVRVPSPPALAQPLEQCLLVNFDHVVEEADPADTMKALRRAFGPDLKNYVMPPHSKKMWLFFRTYRQLRDAASLAVRELVLNEDQKLRIKSTHIVHKSSVVAAKPDSKKSQQGASVLSSGGCSAIGSANVVPSSKPQTPQAAAQLSSHTITLRSASDIVIDACSSKHVLADVRVDLKDVTDAAAGLVSTGECFGKTEKDFIFINFGSRQSAEAALKHYETCKELNLRGKVYAVTAAWDKRSQVAGGSAIGSSRVVCNDDINDLLGLDAKPVSTDVSQWIDTLFDLADAQPLETSKECKSSFLQMLWDGASVESECDAAASAGHSVFSSDSDSDARIDVGTQEADLIQFSDECAQDFVPLSAAEATPVSFGDFEELWTLPTGVVPAAEDMPEAEDTALSPPSLLLIRLDARTIRALCRLSIFVAKCRSLKQASSKQPSSALLT